MLYILTDSDQGKVIRVMPDNLTDAVAGNAQEG